MKQSDQPEFLDAGSLTRPGPIGRLVRLALGAACLYAVSDLVIYSEPIILNPLAAIPGLIVIVIVNLCVFNYVVNIGFGKSWRRWPVFVALAVLATAAGISWLVFGDANHWLPGFALWLWLTYSFLHLGLSFVLAAAMATPGCEMRAIPELFGRLTGHAANEHGCPATFITAIDNWESRR